jgi:aminoglycoside phosphotransferase (APT) family kinase protein
MSGFAELTPRGAPPRLAPDGDAPVRPGEELDAAALEAFLRAHGIEGPVRVSQYPRGFSNLTYRVSAGGREMVLRRPPHGAAVRGGHDVIREFRILAALHPVWPRVPRPLAACDDPGVLGAPFYLMERVEGVVLRDRLPHGEHLDAESMRRICLAAVDTLAELHGVDWQAAGLQEIGRPEGYVRRQVEGWSERWERARTDALDEMDRAARWLAAHLPEEHPAAIIHNDYKYDNLVLDPADLSRVRAVLDWEMATLGDPLMDLGTTLAYWTGSHDPPALQAFGLTHLPGNLDRRQVAEHWAVQTGRSIDGIVFYYVYGLFKVGVIAQQIYARYLAGKTRDPRFAGLIHAVRAAGQTALAAAQRGTL